MTAEQASWVDRLPDAVSELSRRWGLTLGPRFHGEDVTCAWVAPATRRDGTPAVLKLGMPHFEGEDEISGLRLWDGDPTVRLLEADEGLGAMLLERCAPGTPLRELAEPEQDIVIARLLRRAWRVRPLSDAFRPLSLMLAHWSRETVAARERWPDTGLVQEGLRLFATLPGSPPSEALLTTDLHAGNVLRAEREPWLAIDPKPFVGDPAYDATQHLLNCATRVCSDPGGTIRRFADLLGVSDDRVRLWMFARAAAEPRDRWEEPDAMVLARALA